ncbi:MAG: hypothetical protein K6C69_07175 [Lachnospiraceae bacterium]|nr:hypothetical protein [Lachnospiraceae bacterium]
MNWEKISRLTRWIGVADAVVFAVSMTVLINSDRIVKQYEEPVKESIAVVEEQDSVTVDEAVRIAYQEGNYGYLYNILLDYREEITIPAEELSVYKQMASLYHDYEYYQKYKYHLLEADDIPEITEDSEREKIIDNQRRYLANVLLYGKDVIDGSDYYPLSYICEENQEQFLAYYQDITYFYQYYLEFSETEMDQLITMDLSYGNQEDRWEETHSAYGLANYLLEKGVLQ